MSFLNRASKRLLSLDVFRGLAIASMVLVNNPGSWQHVYPPLLHAEWHGFTPTDWIFPGFLFIAGVAMAFSFAKYTKAARPDPRVYWRIARRCLVLFLLGLFLNGFPTYNLSELRIMGVLQRISLAYLLAAIAALRLPRWGLWLLCLAILFGYWAALMWVPVPGFGAGDLSPEGNLAAYVDRLLLSPPHLYLQGDFDPEGLLSTLPAVVTVLSGYLTGGWLRDQPRQSLTSLTLVIVGLTGVALGWQWGLIFPINKHLWTSSFVLFSSGWSLLLLALCYETIEVWRWRGWSRPLEILGMNAIFLFVASGIVTRILYRTHIGTGEDAPTTYRWLYETLFLPWAGELNGSLLFAIANIILWWLILYWLYQRGWFIKV
ncbi:MAG: DUF5009 domain-containing protein [Spirulinaceae cyanobacterium SM2_1_0]|nr:DUF5009 domain-containing protein [Spirulinaceae cyanobacterium SM2_1_0]